MEDKANLQADSFADNDATGMEIATADISFNNGGFTLETVSNLSTVAVPEDGWYDISGHVFFDGSSGRTNPRIRIGRTRGAATIYGIASTGGYLRGEGTFAADSTGAFISQLWELEAGDKIFLQFINSGDIALDLSGDASWLQMVKREGKLTVSGGGGANILELEDNEHLPTPTADTAKYVYRPGKPAQLWIKEEERHSQETGTATQTHILPGSADYADFQGVLNYSPPVTSASLGDYYFDYYYSRRHFYEFAFVGPALTGSNRWVGVAIDDISGDPLGTPDDATSSDAVFLGEATGPHAAILLIDPDDYDATNKYYYVNVAQRRLYLLSAITLPSDPFVSYAYRAMVNPDPTPPQTGIWYIHGQTERWPNSFPYTQNPASSRLRMRWSGNAPNETPYGWDMASIWPAAISGSIDGSANPANTTANVVFTLPAGVWDIEAVIGTETEVFDENEFGLFLYEITVGDDKIRAASSGRHANMPANFGGANGTVIRTELRDVTLDGTEQLYFLVFTFDTDDNFRGFLTLRKKA